MDNTTNQDDAIRNQAVIKALESEWKLVKAGTTIGSHKAEDDSIYTVDDEEVIGCSEWIRADEKILQYIINLHNQWLIIKSSPFF